MLHPGRKVHYPASDGLPMADKDISLIQMVDTRFALSQWFADDPMAYVASNLLVYYEEGNPKSVVAPDVFMARAPKGLRDVYKVWEEGRPPEVVFEFTSRSSRHLDPGFKLSVYDSLGVPEVFLFDPEDKWLSPRFQTYRQAGNRLQRMDIIGPVFSSVLGLELRVEGTWLRLYDPISGRRLCTPDEEADRADREAQRADEADERAHKADERADRANERIRELQNELEQLRRLKDET